MIPRFRIKGPAPENFEYEVFQFSTDIYFVRSMSVGKPEGYLKGISIWKVNEQWVSSAGHNIQLVRKIGESIDSHFAAKQRPAEVLSL